MKFQCCVCQESHEKGIVIIDKFICRSCELEIVETTPEKLKYEVFKKKIKNILTSSS